MWYNTLKVVSIAQASSLVNPSGIVCSRKLMSTPASCIPSTEKISLHIT